MTAASAVLIAGLITMTQSRGAAIDGPPLNCHGIASRILVPESSLQLVTAIVPDHRATSASLQAWERPPGGCFSRLGPPLAAFVGAGGTSTAKREGDGTTPAGIFRLGARIFELGSPLPGAERSQGIGCGSWWDEDPSSPTYNRFVQLACGAHPSFGGASEALWLDTAPYQHFVQVRYNAGPIVPGWGSAIFLHDGTGTPTAGCVSLPPGQLELVLSWLDPGKRPLIAIGTRDDLQTS